MLQENLTVGACVPHGFGRTSTSGSGIAQFQLEFRARKAWDSSMLSKEVAITLPESAKASLQEPREVVHNGGTKRITYLLKDIAHYNPMEEFALQATASFRGILVKPVFGWELYEANGSTTPENAEGASCEFHSELEIKALESLDHVYGTLSWPKPQGGYIRQQLTKHSDGWVHEDEQNIFFPKYEFPTKTNPLVKNGMQRHEFDVEYSSLRAPYKTPVGSRPPCEMVTLYAQVTSMTRAEPDDLPVKVSIEGADISEVALSQSATLQTAVHFFAEISPSY